MEIIGVIYSLHYIDAVNAVVLFYCSRNSNMLSNWLYVKNISPTKCVN